MSPAGHHPSSPIDWAAKRAEILSRIDPLAELEKLGLRRKAGARPSSRGWMPVHSPYREDKRASAGLFVGDGGHRGILVDMSGGDARKKSFWQVFVDLGGAHDYYDALKLFAERTGVQLGHERRAHEGDADAFHEALLSTEAATRLPDERGLNAETAAARKIGWNIKKQCWTIPVRDRDGALVNIKLHGPDVRKSMCRGGPRLFGADRVAKAPPGSIIVITEGEFDAILAEQETGFVGATATNGCRSFQPEFANDLKGHHVILCYDSDAEGKSGAQRTAELLRAAVTAGEILSLRSCRLYPAEDKSRKDVTDFIVKDKHPGVELKAILEAAPVVTFGAADEVIESGSKAVECQAIADSHKRQTIVPGDKPTVIANFWLEVLEEVHIERADGPAERVIHCALRAAKWERLFEVEAGDFHDNRALNKAIGKAGGRLATYDDRQIGLIRVAGQQASENTVCRRQIETFGFLRGSSIPTYCSPDVVIRDGHILPTAKSGINVALPDKHKASGRLNLILAEEAAVRDLLGSTLTNFFDLYTVELGGAVLASVALAIAQDLDGVHRDLDSRAALWIVGPSGTGKTELALMAMRFFGPFTKNDVPSWSDTANNLEMELATCNSAVAVADDWKADLLTGAAMERAKRVLQSYAQGRARHRLNSAAKFIYTPPIRAQLIVTGEDEPQGQTSIKARGLWFDARRIQKNADLYLRIRAASTQFPAITPHLVAFIQRMGARAIVNRFAEASLRMEREALARGIQDDNLHRLAGNLALLVTGLEIFLDFAGAVQAYDASMVSSVKAAFFATMAAALEGQAETIRADRPAEVFLDTLRSLLASGAARLAPLNRGPIANDTVPAEAKVNDQPSIPVVGYTVEAMRPEDAYVLIIPKAAVAVVNDQLRREHGERLNFSPKAISQGLEAMGALSVSQDRHENGVTDTKTLTQVRVNGQRLWVWKLHATALSGENTHE